MIFEEISLIHKMLAEKTCGLDYINQWFKMLHLHSYEIFHMRNIDQEEFNRIKSDIDPKISRKEKDKGEYIKIDKILKENTIRLKTIVENNGCITISKYGIISSHCAWLIAQHSDHDRNFQKEYLRLMEKNKGDVHEDNVLLLRRRLGL